MNYDSSMFELIGSETEGLNVAEKDGKIACIYADINGIGTDSLQIKLKVKPDILSASDAVFTLEDAKFRANGEEASYTGSQINGLTSATKVEIKSSTTENTTNTNSNTNSNTNITNISNAISNTTVTNTVVKTLPKAGYNRNNMIYVFYATLFIAIFGILKLIKNYKEIIK